MTQEKKQSLLDKYQYPINYLDYDFIGKCTEPKTLERILKILKSGEEGLFPQLIEYTEEQLRKYKPRSRLLIKPSQLQKKSNMEKKEWEKTESELMNWVDNMNKVEIEIKDNQKDNRSCIPPVRKTSNISSNAQKNVLSRNQESSKSGRRIKSYDYAAWDKFDVDKALEQIDEAPKSKTIEQTGVEKQKKIPEMEYIDGIPDAERRLLATKEKQKGNDCYTAGDFELAISYYTRSINIDPTPAAYNNRGQCYLMQKEYAKAIVDCSETLKAEPENIKALLRRARAYKEENNLINAKLDVLKLLEIDKNDPNAKKMLNEIESKENAPVRMKIVDVSANSAGGDNEIHLDHRGEKPIDEIKSTATKKSIPVVEVNEEDDIDIESRNMTKIMNEEDSESPVGMVSKPELLSACNTAKTSNNFLPLKLIFRRLVVNKQTLRDIIGDSLDVDILSIIISCIRLMVNKNDDHLRVILKQLVTVRKLKETIKKLPLKKIEELNLIQKKLIKFNIWEDDWRKVQPF